MPRFLFVLVALAVCLDQAAAQSPNGAELGAKAKPVVDSVPAPTADSLAVPTAKVDSAAATPTAVAVGLKDSSVVPPPGTTLAVSKSDSSKVAALTADSVKSLPVAPVSAGAIVTDSSLSSRPAAVASSKDSSSLVAAPDTVAKDSVAQGSPSLAALPKVAPKDSTGGMEWKTLSDSSSDSNYAVIPPSNATPKVTTSSSSSFFPDIPPDRESRVLMYTGAGLAAVGLVAFLVFNGSTSKATTSSASTDNGGGNTPNPNAPSQKTMTIQWAP